MNAESRGYQVSSLKFSIAGRTIGYDNPPYVIAELSGNHNGSIETALQLIDVAAKQGADAVKLQTYTPDTMTLNSERSDFQITDGLWAGRSLYGLYQWAHTPWAWHEALFEKARSLGLTAFSTPFDNTAVDLLETLGAPAYKIASFEAVDLPLIRYVAQKGKPMIISTGMANANEIDEAITAAREAGCAEIALLLCVSGYPAPAADYNLRTIKDMADRWDVVVGLSDHTLDNTTAIAATAMGASLVEKHVTLDRNGGGPDDSFSLEPDELGDLVEGVQTAWQALGSVDYGRKSSERSNVVFRRSLYFVRDLKAGDIIEREDVRSIRPGYGAHPKHLEKIVGMRLKESVSFADPVNIENLANPRF